MRAVLLHKTGGPEELVAAEVPDPKPAPDQCIVRVGAAGVCGRDLIDRSGGFPMKRLPAILGHEFAGEIIEMGEIAAAQSAQSGLKIGDRVVNLHRPTCSTCAMCLARVPMLCERAWQSFGHTIDGAYAERVAAHHSVLVKIPDSLAFEPASTLMCTAGVALQALRGRGRVSLGETVLVTGASGGVGAAAVQLARKMGAHVIATTTSEHKVAALRALGAEAVIVSPDGNFHEEVRRASQGGVELVIECTGPSTFNSSIRSLRKAGRLVLVGNIDKTKIELNLGAVIIYGYEILGSTSCTRKDLLDVLQLVAEKAYTPHVDRALPLDRAQEAHRLLSERAVVGRVVLVP